MSDKKPKRRRRKTVRGYRGGVSPSRGTKPELEVQTPVVAVPESDGPTEPFIQVEYFHDSSGEDYRLSAPWWMYEVRTQNRIYCLDDKLVCMHVLDAKTRQIEASHSLHGARLLGGKVPETSGGAAELSHPLPRRGAYAVFERRVGRRVSLSETSEVSGVLIRLRVVDVSGPQGARVWRKVTGQKAAKPKGEE